MKKLLIIFIFIITCLNNIYSQLFDFGFTMTPVTINQLEFDKPAIILNDYYSYDIGEKSISLGYPSLLGLFNSGLYARYNKRSWFLKIEANYQTKTFRYTRKSEQFKKLFFYYSCFEIPILAGIKLNPEKIICYKIQAGINIEVGKYNHNSFISPFKFFGLNINSNQAMLERISPIIYYYHLAFGFDYYGVSFDLRFEKNINNLNVKQYYYNANFTNTYILRLGLGFKISGRHWDKFRKSKLELKKNN